MYYVFTNDQEFKNYKAGQQMHIHTYPNLPCSTFDPISYRPMPDVVPLTSIPYVTNTIQTIPNRKNQLASEQAAITADLEVYTYVSTYNAVHQLKYAFVDDEEKTAFGRACIRVTQV